MSQSALLIGGPAHEETADPGAGPVAVVGSSVYLLCSDGNYRYQGPDAFVCSGCGAAVLPREDEVVQCALCGEPRPS